MTSIGPQEYFVLLTFILIATNIASALWTAKYMLLLILAFVVFCFLYPKDRQS